MARSIYTEDSAEFITATYTLSVPHPSGYPLYLITSKILSYLPFFDTFVERMHFVSIFWTVLSVILLYYAFIRLFKQNSIAFSLAWLFATAPMVWLQATYAEVYSLNTFFFVLLLWLYLWYTEQPSKKRMHLILFVYGLSLTNHFLPLSLGPLFIGWLLKTYTIQKEWKTYVSLFCVWLLGLLPYLYIPIRARMHPAFVWFGGETTNILKYNIAYGHKISIETLQFITDVIYQFAHAYGWITFIVFLGGIIWMMYNHDTKRYGVLTALFLLSIGLLIALTNGREYTSFAGWFYQTLYVPFLLVCLIPIGYVLQQCSLSKYKLIIFYTPLLAILIWPATQLGDRFLQNDRSEYVFLNNYADNLLVNLPQHANLYAHSDLIVIDPIVFSLAYKQYVERARPDLTIYSLSPVFPAPPDFPTDVTPKKQNDYLSIMQQYLAQKQFLDEQVYTSFPWTDDRLKSIGYGPVHTITHTATPHTFVPYAADNLYLPATQQNFYTEVLFAKYYYDLAAMAYAKGAIKSGQWFMVQAISYDPEQLSSMYQATVALRTKILNN